MSSHNTPKKSHAVDLCSRAPGAGAATTAANDAGAGAAAATGENFGVTVDDAPASAFRPPRALPPRPRPAPAAGAPGFRARCFEAGFAAGAAA